MNRKFRIAAWILGSILVVWATMTVLMAIFSCRPLTASWNLKQYLDPKTVCKPKAYDVTNIYGFCNAVTDAVLIVLPIPLLRKMQITFKRKLGVAMVFATGILYVLLLAHLLVGTEIDLTVVSSQLPLCDNTFHIPHLRRIQAGISSLSKSGVSSHRAISGWLSPCLSMYEYADQNAL